jgi:hypothetical protein
MGRGGPPKGMKVGVGAIVGQTSRSAAGLQTGLPR